MTGAAFNKGASRQDWATPPELVAAVTKRFGPITFDLAADDSNSVALAFYGRSEHCEIDALKSSWPIGNCWLNPPYSNIEPWVQRCYTRPMGCQVILLVPASVGSRWFARYVAGHARVIFLAGRLTFVGAMAPYPKDCMIAQYDPIERTVRREFEIWDWRR